MENECYSMWTEWVIQILPRGGGMEARSIDRRSWLGPLLLVRGWLVEGQGDSG